MRKKNYEGQLLKLGKEWERKKLNDQTGTDTVRAIHCCLFLFLYFKDYANILFFYLKFSF